MSEPRKKPDVRIEVYASGSWIGFHCWPEAPMSVSYLADRHRHKFFWKVTWLVTHGDREVEFCSMQQEIAYYLAQQADMPEVATWSCEQWALALLEEFCAARVEVSEDGENGAIVSR